MSEPAAVVLRDGRGMPPALLLLVGLAVLALAAPGAAAQAMLTIDGVVRAAEGVPLAGAQVTILNLETQERRTLLTGETGGFHALGLAPGRYSVMARRLGYRPSVRSVALVVGQGAHLVFVLDLGPVPLEPLEVRGGQAGMAFEIQRRSIAAPVLEQEIRDLPFSTGNVFELAAVAPGIRSFRSPPQPRTRAAVGLPSSGVHGEGRASNLYVDGLAMKNLYNAGIVGFPETGSPLPVGALREFRVLLNPYDAEYSQAGAYIISAETQRGSNITRASAFGFIQSSGMVSVTDFQRSLPNFTAPDYGRHRLGASLSGPVLKDRLFYAVNYERSDTENIIAVVPGRPQSNPGIWDSFAGNYSAPNRNQVGLVRLTHALPGAHSLEAIWSGRILAGRTLFGGAVSRESAIEQRYRVQTVNLRHRWAGARVAGETSIQLLDWNHREHSPFEGPELLYPTLQIGRSTPHQRIDEQQIRFVQRTSYSRAGPFGSHVLKGGVEIARARAGGRFPLLGRGAFIYPSESSTLPRAARIGVGVNDPGSARDGGASIAGWLLGIYVNDEWRPHRRLSVGAGLRYDVEIDERFDRSALPWFTDPILVERLELRRYLRKERRSDADDISPRISASWDVRGDSRTFVRGGFGIMYDRIPRFAVFQERRDASWRTYEFINPGTNDPEELRRRVIHGEATAQPSLTLLPGRLRTPLTRQWSVGAGHQITSDVVVNVDVLRQDVRHLHTLHNLNWLDRSTTPPSRALTSTYGNILVWDDVARGEYTALLVHLAYERGPQRRLTLAYTLGAARSELDGEVEPVPHAVKRQYFVMQRTSGDERHRLVLSGTHALPLRLTAASIVTLASPRPYRSVDGRDLNANGFTGDDWIEGRRFRVPANVPRNWYRMVDVRLSRSFQHAGREHLSVIAEVFNLFNSTNYAAFAGAQRNELGEPLASFGAPTAIFATRQLQLGARATY